MTLWRHGAEPMKRRSKARLLSRGARRDPVPQLCKLVCGRMLRPCTPQASKLSTGYPQSAEVYLFIAQNLTPLARGFFLSSSTHLAACAVIVGDQPFQFSA